MRPRPPITLWRSILAELLRLGSLTTVALSGLIAFAASLRFLAEGKIDPGGALRLMALALVPMLQYALPFAGGFAATLTYHRLAADNEAAAASAGGLSPRSILAPALAAGVAVCLGVAGLANLVMPRFLRAMEEVVTRDLAGLLERAVERGESIRLGDVELFADQLVRAGPDPGVGAFERLKLRGVLAAQLGPQGLVAGFVSAEEVNAWLFQEDVDGRSATTVQLLFLNASGEGSGGAFGERRLESQRIRIPNAFVEDPKFLTISELLALSRAPQQLGKVDLLRRQLARRLSEQRLIDDARSRLNAEGRVLFERPGGSRLLLTGGALRAEGDAWIVEPARQGQGVEIDLIDASGLARRHRAGSASLEIDRPDAGAAVLQDASPALRLVARELVPLEKDQGAGMPGLESSGFAGLRVAGAAPFDAAAPPPALLREASTVLARASVDQRDQIASASGALRRRIADLQREITSKLHERAAYALACLLTVVAGAVTALRRRSALPLPVYLWSFFPALLAVITISAGQGLTHAAGPPGLLLLWGGVAALGAFVVIEWRRLHAP